MTPETHSPVSLNDFEAIAALDALVPAVPQPVRDYIAGRLAANPRPDAGGVCAGFVWFPMPKPNCRQRLAAEGKPYARSSCLVCGQFSPRAEQCDMLLAAAGSLP
jgi:hypothetical protein